MNTKQHVDKTFAIYVEVVIGDDETESYFSFGSRSVLRRVTDQVRKRQTRSSMYLTMKQMFDKSEKLVSEQDEMNEVKTIDWVLKR